MLVLITDVEIIFVSKTLPDPYLIASFLTNTSTHDNNIKLFSVE